MAKFRNVLQNGLFQTAVKLWKNVVENYNQEITDLNFFDLIRYNVDHDIVEDLVGSAYSDDELATTRYMDYDNRTVSKSDESNKMLYSLWNNSGSREKSKLILEAIADYLIEANRVDKRDLFEERFQELCKILQLTEVESEIVKIAYVMRETDFAWPRRIDNRMKMLFYAMAINHKYEEVRKVMTSTGKLRKFRVLDEDWDFNLRGFGAFLDGSDNEPIARKFYNIMDVSDAIPSRYFKGKLSSDISMLRKLLKKGKGPCNILLYGEPGTGKTSLAKTLAKELDYEAFEIAHGKKDGSEMSSSSRMVGISVANSMELSKRGMLIIDEADELLRNDAVFPFFRGLSNRTEKGVVNSLLDEMRFPAIWIANTAATEIDESVRRRFDYSIKFEKMIDVQRLAIWKNVVESLNLQGLMSEESLCEYAGKYKTSAGGIAKVLSNVKRLRPDPRKVNGLIDELMRSHCELLGIGDNGKLRIAKGYSLDGLNIKGKVEPKRILSAVRNFYDKSFNSESEDRPRMNILMFGPPGTGKTEFAKFLGAKLNKEVMVVKGSDLLDKYVGETEKSIASYFRHAESQGAILFFDEIDGLMQDRSRASQSWQVSQVNELLQQMENFDGVMLAATNFNENLDAAIMRRFTFKLEFDYLNEEGKKIFFEKIFKSKLTVEDFDRLKDLTNLTPGDFRTVRQEFFYLEEAGDNKDRIEALSEECSRKKDGKTRTRIGFAA